MTLQPLDRGPEGAASGPDAEAISGDSAAEHRADPPRGRRARAVCAWVAIVLACLLSITSVIAVYARDQLLNTDTFVSTLKPLASDPVVQSAVATRVSESLVAHTDVQQQIQNALPPRAAFLANPITSTVKSATYSITLKLVQSEQFLRLWEQALRRAHRQLDNLLTGSNQGPFAAKDGQVTVDLSQVEAGAKKLLVARGLTVFDKVPAYTGAPYVLFKSEQLLKVQGLVKLLNQLVVVLPIVALLLFALSVVLAMNRRRGLVHAAAGLAVSMAVLLVAANVGRNQYLETLVTGQSKEASAAVIDTVAAMLLDSVRTILVGAAAVAVVAFAVGTKSVRRLMADRTPPHWLTAGPAHDVVAAHRRAFQWVVVVLGLIVLVLWNQPTATVAVVVVLVTLLVVVLVGLFGRGTPDGADPRPAGGGGAHGLAPGTPRP